MADRLTSWRVLITAAVIVLGLIIIGGSVERVTGSSWWFEKAKAPIPYENVIVHRQILDGDTLHFVATFAKRGCTLVRFVVVGEIVGVTGFLPWKDLDGLARDYDRTAGLQTLRLEIIGASHVDHVELRTRHDCDGVVVDRVFARIDPSRTIQPDGPEPAQGGWAKPVD